MNNYIKYNTHNFASSYEEKAEPVSSEVIAARSKAKAKPQPRESSGTMTIPFNERIWIDIKPSKQDFDSYKLSKRVINLLRHNRNVNRERDGAVQFYKIIFLMRDHSLSTQNWSDNRWLACLAAGGGPKRRYQCAPVCCVVVAFSSPVSCLLLHPTVLLPALPDVHLRVQREVQVQPPVRLPLGDRGHF